MGLALGPYPDAGCWPVPMPLDQKNLESVLLAVAGLINPKP